MRTQVAGWISRHKVLCWVAACIALTPLIHLVPDWLTNAIGLVWVAVGFWAAVTVYRRPLRQEERTLVAVTLVVLALAALAYRLGNLEHS